MWWVSKSPLLLLMFLVTSCFAWTPPCQNQIIQQRGTVVEGYRLSNFAWSHLKNSGNRVLSPFIISFLLFWSKYQKWANTSPWTVLKESTWTHLFNMYDPIRHLKPHLMGILATTHRMFVYLFVTCVLLRNSYTDWHEIWCWVGVLYCDHLFYRIILRNYPTEKVWIYM